MTLKIIFYTKPLYINIYKQFNLIGYEDDVEPRNRSGYIEETAEAGC